MNSILFYCKKSVVSRVSGPDFFGFFGTFFPVRQFFCLIAQIEALDQLIQKNKEKNDFDHHGAPEG